MKIFYTTISLAVYIGILFFWGSVQMLSQIDRPQIFLNPFGSDYIPESLKYIFLVFIVGSIPGVVAYKNFKNKKIALFL